MLNQSTECLIYVRLLPVPKLVREKLNVWIEVRKKSYKKYSQGFFIDPINKSRAYVQFTKSDKTLFTAKGYTRAEAFAKKKDLSLFEQGQKLLKKASSYVVNPAADTFQINIAHGKIEILDKCLSPSKVYLQNNENQK